MELLSKEELKKRILIETSSLGTRNHTKQFEIVEIEGGYAYRTGMGKVLQSFPI